MEDSARPSSFRGGERKLEIVSGRGGGGGGGYNHNNQMYTTTWPRTEESPPLPAAEIRPNQVASSSSKPWGFRDPEMKRRKRIAKYKVYTVEGRVKASIRNGFRWIKNKCSEMIHGY